jgi:hypothetical protein
MTMNRTLILMALGWSAAIAIAQGPPNMTPTILMGPSDWRFESMPTPPQFAPDIRLTGFEEARFSPGMFDNTSPSYFTYVLVISADGAPDLGTAALKDILEKYYRGLSVGLGQQKGLSVDPKQMIAEIAPAQGDKTRRHAKVTFIDTFTDGRKITLNIEAHIVAKPAAKKTGLILLVSPQPKDHAVWQKLHEIDAKIAF